MAEQSIEFRYDTQMLIDGDIDEDELDEYITENFEGDSLLVMADDGTATSIPHEQALGDTRILFHSRRDLRYSRGGYGQTVERS